MEKIAPQRSSGAEAEWIEIVREKVQSLRFGVVQIIVHEGRVIQVERTEKVRLNPGNSSTRRESIDE
ncbi:MAG: YezD family protein [Chthoniobacteraceae bacterium]